MAFVVTPYKRPDERAGGNVVPHRELQARRIKKHSDAHQRECDRYWEVYGALLAIIEEQHPRKALSMLQGCVLRVLTNKHGDNAEKIRPDLNEFARELRRDAGLSGRRS